MSDRVIAAIEAESENLALHVQLCEQRYLQLISKFDAVEQRFSKLEDMLVEIKDSVKSTDVMKYKMYLSWAGAGILALIGVIAALLKH